MNQIPIPNPIMMKIDGEIVRVVFSNITKSRIHFTSYQPKTGIMIGKHELAMIWWNAHYTDRITYFHGHSYKFLPKNQEVINETQLEE